MVPIIIIIIFIIIIIIIIIIISKKYTHIHVYSQYIYMYVWEGVYEIISFKTVLMHPNYRKKKPNFPERFRKGSEYAETPS